MRRQQYTAHPESQGSTPSSSFRSADRASARRNISMKTFPSDSRRDVFSDRPLSAPPLRPPPSTGTTALHESRISSPRQLRRGNVLVPPSPLSLHTLTLVTNSRVEMPRPASSAHTMSPRAQRSSPAPTRASRLTAADDERALEEDPPAPTRALSASAPPPAAARPPPKPTWRRPAHEPDPAALSRFDDDGKLVNSARGQPAWKRAPLRKPFNLANLIGLKVRLPRHACSFSHDLP